MINIRAPGGANKASNCIHQYFLLYKMEISMALVISDMIVCGWSFGQREIQRSSNWSHFPLLVKLSRDGGKLIPTSARISPSYSLNSTLCPVALTAPTMFLETVCFCLGRNIIVWGVFDICDYYRDSVCLIPTEGQEGSENVSDRHAQPTNRQYTYMSYIRYSVYYIWWYAVCEKGLTFQCRPWGLS